MKKIVLIDGTNLIFRAYFATATTGRLMRTSKGLPTNAIYGLVTMLNKILKEEQPDYIAVALDEGKTFRHAMYSEYKAKRNEVPNELIVQFDYIKRLLDGLGVNWLTASNYEADDIVGSIVNQYKLDYEIIAISGDQDYLQLIDKNVVVKLLKKGEFIYYNEDKLLDDYGLMPSQILDLKALEGDKSDNIVGVAGIGEKTAIKLILEYGSIEGIYENIDKISGKLQEKLINGKSDAFFSKEMVTIYNKLEFDIDGLNYKNESTDLHKLYEELEFHSFLKNIEKTKVVDIDYEIITSLKDYLEDDSTVYFEYFGKKLHEEQIIGMALINSKGKFFISEFDLLNCIEDLFDYSLNTYDYKKIHYYCIKNYGKCFSINFDFMLAMYSLDKKGDELSEFATIYGNTILSDEEIFGKGAKYVFPDSEVIAKNTVIKANFIHKHVKDIIDEMKKIGVYEMYLDIELPLASVLSKMELDGIAIDKSFLKEMSLEVGKTINDVEKKIYEIANQEFNISSYKQLGKVLFEDLSIPYPKKLKANESYKTNIDILNMLSGEEIVKYILEYRGLKKLQGTYLDGLIPHIESDGKIHTVYNQVLASTGRLSSIDPNLQNIPIRSELGKEIRKAFIASPSHQLLACDYSQIELRILAHLSNSDKLIDAFNNGLDIHAITASDMYGIDISMVDATMRRNAKAINFGIIYGMSEFGLSQSLDVDVFTARDFINRYFNEYDSIKLYLDSAIASAKDNGYTKTLFNRIRYINELSSNNYTIRQFGERLAMNTPIQGSAADIIKIAMINISREFEEKGLMSKMILQIHDELIFDVASGEDDLVLEIVLRNMHNAYYTKHISLNLKVKLDVEYSFGINWFEAK